MALIDKDAAVVAVRDALKVNPTRAIRAMHVIRELEEVEAIPVAWIEEYINGFKRFAYGNGMSDMVAFQMRDMVEKWRGRQK